MRKFFASPVGALLMGLGLLLASAPKALMAEAQTLRGISAGAAFMGANSHIGNAPNFMVVPLRSQAV